MVYAALLPLVAMNVSPASIAAVSRAQEISNPKIGSPVRKAIMEAMRPRVERLLGVPVLFQVRDLNVWRNWAFAMVTPLEKSGKKMDFSKTLRRKEYANGTDDNFNGDCAALLKSSRPGSWKIVDFYYGMTDVPWATPKAMHGLPKELFSIH